MTFPSADSGTLSYSEVDSMEETIASTFKSTVTSSDSFSTDSLTMGRVEIQSQSSGSTRRLQESSNESSFELTLTGVVVFLSYDGSVPALSFTNPAVYSLFLQLETDLGDAVMSDASGFSIQFVGKPTITFPAHVTDSPTITPTQGPTFSPSASPSSLPSVSVMPSVVPSLEPTFSPSVSPSLSLMPTDSPTSTPVPTVTASMMPSSTPSTCRHESTCLEGRKVCVGSEPFCAWTNS
jgi:hypothetical protein